MKFLYTELDSKRRFLTGLQSDNVSVDDLKATGMKGGAICDLVEKMVEQRKGQLKLKKESCLSMKENLENVLDGAATDYDLLINSGQNFKLKLDQLAWASNGDSKMDFESRELQDLEREIEKQVKGHFQFFSCGALTPSKRSLLAQAELEAAELEQTVKALETAEGEQEDRIRAVVKSSEESLWSV